MPVRGAGDEADLVEWARRTSLGVVRAKANPEVRRSRDERIEIERSRSVRTWYFDEGTRFAMEAELPAADGAIVEPGSVRDHRAAVGLVVGNEGAGVGPALEAAASRRVAIRLAPGAESLNVAVAAAILLREVARAD